MADGQIARQARAEILAFEHARQAIVRAQANHVVPGEFSEPLGVVADLGIFPAQNFVHLFEIRLRVGVHLLARQGRARLGLAGGIADHRREIADQKNRRVAQVLKMFQLAQHDGVAQVQVGRGRVHAQLHAQRLAGLARSFELRAQIFFANNFRRALAQIGELFVHGLELFVSWS